VLCEIGPPFVAQRLPIPLRLDCNLLGNCPAADKHYRYRVLTFRFQFPPDDTVSGKGRPRSLVVWAVLASDR